MTKDNSLLSSVVLFSLSFICFEADVTWLDEIAEGLKNVMSAINKTILKFMNKVNIQNEQPFAESKIVKSLQNILRQITYTLGFIA